MDGRGGVEEIERSARSAGAPFDVFVYPGEGHLFADPEGPEYDAEAARLMLERELEFLSSLDA